MARAFVNVLDNARRHSGGHPVAVRARAVRNPLGARRSAAPDGHAGVAGAGRGDRIVIRITDRGPGVPAGQLEEVFEPFYRAAGGGRPRRLGLGARDRPGVHRGERRHAECRVAAGTGRHVRVRAAARGRAGAGGAAAARSFSGQASLFGEDDGVARGSLSPRPPAMATGRPRASARPRWAPGNQSRPPGRPACSSSTTSPRSCAR